MAQAINKLLDAGSLFRCFLHFASVQTLEFGKFLTCTLGGTGADERLSKPVVDGRVVTVKLEGLFILGDSVVVLVLIRIRMPSWRNASAFRGSSETAEAPEKRSGTVVENGRGHKARYPGLFPVGPNAGGTRAAGYTAPKNLNRGFKGLMQEQFHTPC